MLYISNWRCLKTDVKGENVNSYETGYKHIILAIKINILNTMDQWKSLAWWNTCIQKYFSQNLQKCFGQNLQKVSYTSMNYWYHAFNNSYTSINYW
jgi:hypothetical protein